MVLCKVPQRSQIFASVRKCPRTTANEIVHKAGGRSFDVVPNLHFLREPGGKVNFESTRFHRVLPIEMNSWTVFARHQRQQRMRVLQTTWATDESLARDCIQSSPIILFNEFNEVTTTD